MTRGRRRPDRLVELSGEQPPTRPAAVRGDLRPPPWLSPAARRIWRQTIADAPDVLAKADVYTLASYCALVVTVADLTRELDAGGLDEMARARRLRERRSSIVLLVKVARELGLTPSARMSMSVDVDGDDGDDLEAWLS